MSTVLSVLALVLSVAALGCAVVVLRRSSTRDSARAASAEGLPDDPRALRQEVAALRAEHGQALQHLAVVRYDAFSDMGGHLSWSLALVDDHGSGVVLTSIAGRNDARTYAKSVTDWTSEAQLSPEETEAIGHARAGRL